jgi:protein disulfide-isomerase
MRSIFYSLLSLATVASALAVDTASATPTGKDDDWEEKTPDTIFNGETVPPMIELRKDNLDSEISKGNWYVNVVRLSWTLLILSLG